MANYTENKVTFSNIIQPDFVIGSRISKGTYRTDENDNIKKIPALINAIEIDWNNAVVEGLEDYPITTTASLLQLIADIKNTNPNINLEEILGNLGTKPAQGEEGSEDYEPERSYTVVEYVINKLNAKIGNLGKNDEGQSYTVKEYIDDAITKGVDINPESLNIDAYTKEEVDNKLGDLGEKPAQGEEGNEDYVPARSYTVVEYIANYVINKLNAKIGNLGKNDEGQSYTVKEYIDDIIEKLDIDIDPESLNIDAYTKDEIDNKLGNLGTKSAQGEEGSEDYEPERSYTVVEYVINKLNAKIGNLGKNGEGQSYTVREYIDDAITNGVDIDPESLNIDAYTKEEVDNKLGDLGEKPAQGEEGNEDYVPARSYTVVEYITNYVINKLNAKIGDLGKNGEGQSYTVKEYIDNIIENLNIEIEPGSDIDIDNLADELKNNTKFKKYITDTVTSKIKGKVGNLGTYIDNDGNERTATVVDFVNFKLGNLGIKTPQVGEEGDDDYQAEIPYTVEEFVNNKVGDLGYIDPVGEEGEENYIPGHNATVEEYGVKLYSQLLTKVNNKIGSIPEGYNNIKEYIDDKSDDIDMASIRNEVNTIVNDSHQVMTTAEYNALREKDSHTVYFLTDESGEIEPTGQTEPITPSGEIEPTGPTGENYDINNIEPITTALYVNDGTGEILRTENNISLIPGGKYTLRGTLAGSILIDTSNANINTLENTELILNNVTIVNTTSNNGIKYQIPTSGKYKDLVITLAPNSKNYVICTNEAAITDDQPGAIYSMNNLTIQGAGYLACYNKGGHGIRGNQLNLYGPHIYVDAIHDAIHAKDMYICGGTYYIENANDAFGTGIGGSIYYAFGDIYVKTLNGRIMNAKSGQNTQGVEKTGSIVAIESINSNVHYVNENTTYTINGTITNIRDLYTTNTAVIKEYETDDEAKGGYDYGTNIEVVNGKYCPTKPNIYISGYFDKPIYLDSDLEDVTIYMYNAVIETSEVNNYNSASICYDNTSGNVKIFCLNDSYNAIINNCSSVKTDQDCDAIKSEHNLNIELKNNSYLYITSSHGDGIDGTDVNITDSKGSLFIHNCGERGIKGTNVILGPKGSTPNGLETVTLITNVNDEKYSTFDGALIVTENCNVYNYSQPSITGQGKISAGTGYADIYGRKGKAIDKGSLYITNNELKGVVICNAIGAIVNMSLDNATNFYYNEDYSYNNVVRTNIPAINNENYLVIAYKNIGK